jgi:hypothetical protein
MYLVVGLLREAETVTASGLDGNVILSYFSGEFDRPKAFAALSLVFAGYNFPQESRETPVGSLFVASAVEDMAMSASATRIRLQELIDRLSGQMDASIPSSVNEALQSLVSAVDYKDVALLQAAIHETLTALQESIEQAVQRRLGWPRQVKANCRRVIELIKGCPSENWDEAGTHLEARFSGMLKDLTELRDGPVKFLQEHGYPIGNAGQLDSDIGELRELKQGVLGDWPWSNKPLPPVDWEMARKAMADMKKGKPGEPLEDLIRRLGGTPTSGN